MRTLLFMLLIISTLQCVAQNNFTYTPAKPKAGEVISIKYSPGGNIANTSSLITATVGILDNKGLNVNDLDLTRTANVYTCTIKTDTSDNFVFLSFAADKIFDNNFNDGYWIKLYEGDQLKKGADMSLSLFYQFYGRASGVDPNNEKALVAMDQEFKNYPETKKANLVAYDRLYLQEKKDDNTGFIERQIESALKEGLKEEEDYTRLQNLYALAKLPQQSIMIAKMAKEKYPNGKTVIGEIIQKFLSENDITKKEQMLAEITGKIKTDPNWKYLTPSLTFFQSSVPGLYVSKKDWSAVKTTANKYNLKGQELANLYNNTAWEMQGSNDNLPLAAEFSNEAVSWAKNELEHPSGVKPGFITKTQWIESLKSQYAMYADTYGMVMYKMGEFKKGLPFSEDAALKIGKGQDADENTTYALLAEKSLPEKKYVPKLEQFVKDGKSTSGINDILKRVYIRRNNSESGFDDYIAALSKSSYLKMIEDIRKGILNEATPSFALLDLSGKKVDIADLRNKIVVVDFWATWCGPCKASFPGMQKMIAKYKNDPEVQFLFVDTWEREDAKEKNAENFITSKKYDFHVLMDNDNKVIESFKVNGIPTKFVIDRSGKIRFKAIGFDGSDDKLVSELSAMIDMAKSPSN